MWLKLANHSVDGLLFHQPPLMIRTERSAQHGREFSLSQKNQEREMSKIDHELAVFKLTVYLAGSTGFSNARQLRVRNDVNRVLSYKRSRGSHVVVGSMEAPSINNTTLMKALFTAYGNIC